MIQEISTSNDYSYNVRQNLHPQVFEAKTPALPNDSFESSTQPQVIEKKTFFGWFDGVCAAIAAGSLFMLRKGHTDTKSANKIIGETFEAIGEKLPDNIVQGAQKLKVWATRDRLSGLNNRATFDAAIKKFAKETAENGGEMHMAMFDMDYFKSINEILGHQTGDRFIQLLSKNISDVAAEHGSSAYRYGGEEIAVLMPRHNAESAKKIAQKIADKIKGDTEIQSHKGKFLEAAQKRLDEFTEQQEKYDSLWDKIRGQGNPKQNELAEEVLTFLGEKPHAETAAEKKSLQEAIKKLQAIKSGQSDATVHSVITEHKPIVASALNKQHNKKDELVHIQRWIDHVNNNGGFTISAGIGGTKTNEPEKLLERANTALEKKAKIIRNSIAIAD